MGRDEARRYLQERLEFIVPMVDKPRWREKDIDAVLALLEYRATQEQLALARIEGIARFSNYENAEKLSRIKLLARAVVGDGS